MEEKMHTPTPRFQIGDTAYMATFDAVPARITCPDCGGDGRLRVLLHDDTMVSVECRACSSGYEPPRGYLMVYDRAPRAEIVTVTGFEVGEGGVEYRTTSSYCVKDDRLFATKEEAMSKAQFISAEHDREERERIKSKEKDSRSWAWNAHYHRREIKEAQRRIEYHTAKLNVASLKAKAARAALKPGT